jgi:RNA polymerase sigma-70 factor (ECF subfamily)
VQAVAASFPDITLDIDSQTWLDRLTGPSPRREEAIGELHDLLLKAARFEVRRRGARDQDDLAHQAADDALMAVLGKLDDFRGDSRFTTWAYKFALLEAGVKARRRAWQGREIPLEDEGWARIADLGSAPDRDAETAELLGAVTEAMKRDLSPHQRRVLLAVAVDGVPIDVMAERLDSTRGALYKTIHDARAKLRAALEER